MKPYYEHGGITIYHGDCREVMGCLPVAFCRRCNEPLMDEEILAIHLAAQHDVRPFCDFVLTDPPYGSLMPPRPLTKTPRQWQSAKEPPNHDGDVLCFQSGRRFFVGWYDSKRKRWWKANRSYIPELTHWRKLPEPPK